SVQSGSAIGAVATVCATRLPEVLSRHRVRSVEGANRDLIDIGIELHVGSIAGQQSIAGSVALVLQLQGRFPRNCLRDDKAPVFGVRGFVVTHLQHANTTVAVGSAVRGIPHLVKRSSAAGCIPNALGYVLAAADVISRYLPSVNPESSTE